MSIKMKGFNFAATFSLGFLGFSVLFIAPAQAGLKGATAKINPSTRIIDVTGTITDNETIIDFTISDVPSGNWTVQKEEKNDTGESWLAWEIVFGDDTEIISDGMFSSNFFQQTTVIPERNAIVFHDGEVPSGETLLKTFQVNQSSALAMSHNRATTVPTMSQIQNGFPSRPRSSVTVEPQTVPEPATILGTATVLGCGTLLKREHSKKQKKG